MGQKDNYLNLRTANISLEIAEMSREDNLQMKEIALATARDSTDMRSIAVLTLVFLPPTFTATFFSTSFYDFSPGGGKIVSHFHWVYVKPEPPSNFNSLRCVRIRRYSDGMPKYFYDP